MASATMVRKRNTWQRDAIFQALKGLRCHVTVEELHERLKKGSGRIGLATVYRTVSAFVKEGVVEPAHVGDGKVRYGLGANHHDHVVCLNCGVWEPMIQCVVRPPRRLASGFKVTGHQLEVYGYCARCQAASA